MKYKLIINLKAYEEGLGENALVLANICKSLEKEANAKNVEIILCPSMVDIKDIVRSGVKTYSQHIDNYDYGAHTGSVIPHSIKCAGASGSLINHSEHRIDSSEITANISILKELGLKSCICVENASEVKKVSKFKPDYIAVEPKELIGGDISISTAQPSLISDSVTKANKIPLLVGAGVKNGKDVKVAVKLGSMGILVASGVVKVKDPKGAILDLLSGF